MRSECHFEERRPEAGQQPVQLQQQQLLLLPLRLSAAVGAPPMPQLWPQVRLWGGCHHQEELLRRQQAPLVDRGGGPL